MKVKMIIIIPGRHGFRIGQCTQKEVQFDFVRVWQFVSTGLKLAIG